MKNAVKLCSVLFCSVLLLTSCSDFMSRDEEGSALTLRFNGAAFSGGPRNVTPDTSDEESFWITVAISGDYTGSKTVKVDSSPTTYQMVFDDIPVGSTITIDANAYSLGNPVSGCHKYTGSKSNVAIGPGQTDVDIAMTNVDLKTNLNLSTDISTYYAHISGDESGKNYSVFLLANHKYVIVENDNNKCVSEGLYEGDMTSNGTLYLKEYVYIQCTRNADGSADWGSYVYTFVDAPQPVAVTYEISGSTDSGSIVIDTFDFTSANDVTYFISH
ncbi:MAG: hypothetical protein K6E51_07280 [Treponema sp.]|nr:hypothetical protein [Treponema sp.]